MEADVENSVDDRNNILYDFTIQTEWQQDPEVLFRSSREKYVSLVSLGGHLTTVVAASAWRLLQAVGIPIRNGAPCVLPPNLVKLVSTQMNWHFDVSRDGHVVVLQDDSIEVRTWKDEYGSCLAKWPVASDSHPQWRVVTWSPDADMIAYSDSSGSVKVYDMMGTHICSIESVCTASSNTPVDLSCAACSLIFKEPRNKQNWDYELLVFTYQGTLKNYSISQSGEYSLVNTFSFASHYPGGISSVTYSPSHSLLFVGGGGEPVSQQDTDTPTAMQLGITAWRILSDIPHYKLVTDYDDDRMVNRSSKLLKKLRMLSYWNQEEQDGIYKLCLSPKYQLLAAIHHSGSLTLLDIPSLRIRHSWTQEEQPGYNEVDQNIAENPKLRKVYKEQLTAFYLTDINWWSDQELILARGTGAVTVSCVKTLKNLLGNSPEWFKGAPLLSMSNGTGFLGMECESKYSQLKRARNEPETDYEDSDDEEDLTLVTRTKKIVRQVLYFVTDNEQFQPPRKRPKVVTKTYRLVYLKSTTPEELYTRKIENEEYGEALALAKCYNLDCDLVYQRQWRKTPVSVASIQDYLSKISKRSWVLRECLERVPENIDAMRELLHYGLHGTDLEALLAIGRGEDGGRFILCDHSGMYDESIDVFDPKAVEDAKIKEKEYIQDLLNQVDFKNLTLEQKELCRARSKLVQYYNRLQTYEEVLGGAHYAPSKYDPKFFEMFRSRNIVEVATQYAQDCDWEALEVIFTYHGADTLPHRLAILTHFLETYQPKNYKSLLPSLNSVTGSIQTWTEQKWREEDWCQLPECQAVIDPEPADLGAFLYDDDPELVKFKGTDLSSDCLTEWYRYRACQIEHLCRLVDLALSLVTIAREEKHIQGLDDLYDDLLTMDTLVYDCLIDESLTFEKMLDMPYIDRLRLMMSRSSKEMYAKNVWAWLVPFLQRCDKKKPGSFLSLIREYLVSMAKEDLTFCVIVFQCCRLDQPNPIITDAAAIISMALECIYSCQSNDQLSNTYRILNCLPPRPLGVVNELTKLHDSVNELKAHLSAAEILEKHHLPQTISYIRDSQDSEEEAKALFTKLTRKAGRSEPTLTETQWKELLSDVLTLRDKVYKCVEPSLCYQIFVESLLCSSNEKNIELAGQMMECSPSSSQSLVSRTPDSGDGPVTMKVTYDTAVQLVLQVAREYFDSSTKLTDVSMELARACLNLIEEAPACIKEELDLIDALATLHGFGVSILPLQVRMCKDKLELIQQAIDSRQYTYKNSQRLLKLGRQLHLPGKTDVEKDGPVLQLIAKKALKVEDLSVCHEMCERLMYMGYPNIWTECKALAQMEAFSDIPSKMELLSYAMTHCTPDMIEPILRAKCLLETQVIYERVHSQMADRESQSPIENPFSAKGAIQQTKEILSTTNKATRKILSNVSNKSWWKKTLKSLKPMHPIRYVTQTDNLNEDFSKQGCHPFYESAIKNSYINRSEVDYERLCCSKPEIYDLHFTEALFYASKLEEMLSEGERCQPSTEVLHQLASDSMAVDSTLGLCYLLALPNALDAEKTLEKHKSSAISLQLAAYYYAIQVCSRLDPSVPAHIKLLYHYAPVELIQKMLSHAKWMEENGKTDRWSDEVKALVSRLRHYHELLMDFSQAEALRQLNRGIDIGRFTVDPVYKTETILGLSMTADDYVYEIAVSLAKRYDVPLWDIYMAHLEYLFDSGLPTVEIEKRVRDMDLLATLQADKDKFIDRMNHYVYPGIAGTDHNRLILYYSMLESCATDDLITPSTHVKLLRKIRSAAPGLDYKSLTDGEHEPLDVLQPVLTPDNISVLVKVASKLPDKHGGYLQPSLIYCGWAIQSFWQGGQKPGKEKIEWIHQYELCGEYLQKLLPQDVIQFIDAITFVPAATQQLAPDCRRQIVRRALKYSRQQLAASKKKDQVPGGSWEKVVQHMQQSLEHLDKLNNPVIVNMRQSDDPQLQAYATDFDLSRSEQEKLEQLYLKMALDGQSPDVINDVISTAKLSTTSTRTIYRQAIQIIVDAIREKNTASSLLKDRDTMSVLRVIIQQVGEHEKNCGDLVSSEDLMAILRGFCSDNSVPVDTRLQVLTVMEQCFSLQSEDLVLLILYRTDAIVSSAWKDKHVSTEAVSSDEARSNLFHTLLEDSEHIEQFRALINLLHVWPTLRDSSATEPAVNPWFQLLSAMIRKCKQLCATDVVSTVRELVKNKQLSDKLLTSIHEVLVESHLPIIAVKCLLMSEQSSLHQKAVDILREQSSTEGEDDELFILLLQRYLTASIVNTIFYPSLTRYILANQVMDGEVPYYLSVETIANQLQDAEHQAEAGSLLITHSGTHQALRTFDTALGFLNRWLTR